jgi:hypothetical protein
MRAILIITVLILGLRVDLFAQVDFVTMDKRTYNYYLKGDYRNLKASADSMLSMGIDYYYLRMRVGILAYENEKYKTAFVHFNQAHKFNSLDSSCTKYIYYCYLFSGRKADASLCLRTGPEKAIHGSPSLTSESSNPISVSAGFSFIDYQTAQHETSNLYHEALSGSFSMYTGIEKYFSANFKAEFAYTNYHKTGKVYTATDPLGSEMNFSQNQLWLKLSGIAFPGWEFYGFGHVIFYRDTLFNIQSGNQSSANLMTQEYEGGIGISKSGWKVRANANLSLSNFSFSSQVRGEAYLTFLPSGNENFYLSSGWMGQTDVNWGGTYQLNQEVGFKICKMLWMETGYLSGNSFLYARNDGYMVNNSFLIPSKVAYANIIILPGKHFAVTITPSFVQNEVYSWNLNRYTRTDKQIVNSFGGSIKLTYKER